MILGILLAIAQEEAKATIRGVSEEWAEHEYEFGYRFSVDFAVEGCYGVPCLLRIGFFDDQRRPLPDRNGECCDDEDHVALVQEFTPAFSRSDFPTFPLFLPGNELHLDLEKAHSLLYRASVLRKEGEEYRELAVSDFRPWSFCWSGPPARGAITRLSVDTHARQENRKGIRITCDYEVEGGKGLKGARYARFFRKGDRLEDLWVHGRSEEGPLEVREEFEFREEKAKAAGAQIWVPYDSFPLKKGRNVFHFKLSVLAQKNLPDDNRWYDLDATNAWEFVVENGALRLREVWGIEDWEVTFDWSPTSDEKKLVEGALTRFNNRLFDATDGQVRVRSFRLQEEAHPARGHPTALRFFRDFSKGEHGETDAVAKAFLRQTRAFAYLGNPAHPGDIHVPYATLGASGAELFSRILVHEFCHAAFGLADEYEDRKDDAGRVSSVTLCAKDEDLRRAWNSCLMGSHHPFFTELCRPESHHQDSSRTSLAAGDCYTRVQKSLRDSLRLEVVIPETPIVGPDDPDMPTFRW